MCSSQAFLPTMCVIKAEEQPGPALVRGREKAPFSPSPYCAFPQLLPPTARHLAKRQRRVYLGAVITCYILNN